MGKNKQTIATEFEERVMDEGGRGRGWLMTLLVLGLIGAVIWFVMAQD